MLGSAFWLTLATLLGLCLGFAREWLLVASWGAGERSDAFLIALFLPEALRMSLAGGVLSAAALPLFLERQGERRLDWLAAILPALLGIAVALSLLLLAAAPWLVRLLGPGLAETASAQAAANLRVLAWCVPGLMLHALFSIPLQAAERFVLAGLGSLLFNLPPVLYLALHGQASQPEQLALACLLGSLLMPLVLLPSLWIEGWRPWHWRLSGTELGELGGRIAPLLLSNAASQGLALVERLVASLLGEGAVTWVNLARKLMNLPLIALMSLNQVLLGMMSRRQGGERLALLRRGLETASLLTLPAGVGLVAAAPGLVALLLPRQTAGSPLPALLAWFAVPLVFGAWNALLARYAYAAGDTRLPLRCELLGSALNAALLAVLPLIFGLPGIPLAALGGVLCTALLLMRRQALLGALPWARLWLLNALAMALAAGLLFRIDGIWLQFRDLLRGQPLLPDIGGVLYASVDTLPWQALWYLPHFWVATLFAWFMLRVIQRLGLSLAASCVLLAVQLGLGILFLKTFWQIPVEFGGEQYLLPGLPFSLDITLISSAHFMFGYVLRDVLRRHQSSLLTLCIALAVTTASFLYYPTVVDMAQRRYDHWFWATVQAVSGVYLCWALSGLMMKIDWLGKAMTYIGQSTLILLIFHGEIQHKTFNLLVHLGLSEPAAASVALVISVIVSLLIGEVIKRVALLRALYFPFPVRKKAAAVQGGGEAR